MISRASRMLTHKFDENTHISQLFSTILYNLVFGELIQAKRDLESVLDNKFLYDEYFDSYIAKTYFKTASMISIGCRAVALIMDLSH